MLLETVLVSFCKFLENIAFSRILFKVYSSYAASVTKHTIAKKPNSWKEIRLFMEVSVSVNELDDYLIRLKY